jgi:hypothetical protein
VTINIDVWLRGTDFAKSERFESIEHEPGAWTDADVRRLLEGMLGTMHRLKHPEESTPPISLRGLSWIVNPFEGGGVVIALEVGMGAAVAGPFDIDGAALDKMISRVLAPPPGPSSGTVH